MNYRLIEAKNNGYDYEALENGKVIKTGFIGVADEAEALNTLQNRSLPTELEILKSRLISKTKSHASKLLSATDYKVIRHRDQIELNVRTALTDLEYDNLLKDLNDLRNWSNAKEIEINNATTIAELENIDTEY
jgi:hypothetical protein